MNAEGIHQGEDVERERGLVDVAGRGGRQEPRGAVAAEVRDDHPVPFGRQERCDLDVAVDVIRESVHEDHRRAAGGPAST